MFNKTRSNDGYGNFKSKTLASHLCTPNDAASRTYTMLGVTRPVKRFNVKYHLRRQAEYTSFAHGEKLHILQSDEQEHFREPDIIALSSLQSSRIRSFTYILMKEYVDWSCNWLEQQCSKTIFIGQVTVETKISSYSDSSQHLC